jgi:hypothetical protein
MEQVGDEPIHQFDRMLVTRHFLLDQVLVLYISRLALAFQTELTQ